MKVLKPHTHTLTRAGQSVESTPQHIGHFVHTHRSKWFAFGAKSLSIKKENHTRVQHFELNRRTDGIQTGMLHILHTIPAFTNNRTTYDVDWTRVHTFAAHSTAPHLLRVKS